MAADQNYPRIETMTQSLLNRGQVSTISAHPIRACFCEDSLSHTPLDCGVLKALARMFELERFRENGASRYQG